MNYLGVNNIKNSNLSRDNNYNYNSFNRLRVSKLKYKKVRRISYHQNKLYLRYHSKNNRNLRDRRRKLIKLMIKKRNQPNQ